MELVFLIVGFIAGILIAASWQKDLEEKEAMKKTDLEILRLLNEMKKLKHSIKKS